MAVQDNYEWITWSRARVLRELAEMRTESEAAKRLGMTYSGVRSIVGDIKHYTASTTSEISAAGGASTDRSGSTGPRSKAV